MAIISAYAPTETKATQEELQDFYVVLMQTLKIAVAKVGKERVIVAGDFNLDLASAARELQTTKRLLGRRIKEGNGSKNANMHSKMQTGPWRGKESQ